MKRFLMTTALVMTTATGAALADNDQMRYAVDQFLTQTNWDIDVDTLTDAQVAKLHAAMSSTETSSDQIGKVRAILAEENVRGWDDSDVAMDGVYDDDDPLAEKDGDVIIVVGGAEMPRSQIFLSVENGLIGTEFAGRAGELSDEELVEAYAAITGTDDASTRNSRLTGIFN